MTHCFKGCKRCFYIMNHFLDLVWHKHMKFTLKEHYPNSKIHGANMGPIWGCQDPGGPHVGPMNFAIWVHAPYPTVNAMPADALATSGARASTGMAFHTESQNIPSSASEELITHGPTMRTTWTQDKIYVMISVDTLGCSHRRIWGVCSEHYCDVIMGTMVSQITSLMIVYSTVYSSADQKKIIAPCHWPLCGDLTSDWWIPRANGQ